MPEWEPMASVVRSECHDRTWIGHVRDAGFEDTPAGPLNVVKRACVTMVVCGTERHRWRRGNADTWVLEVADG